MRRVVNFEKQIGIYTTSGTYNFPASPKTGSRWYLTPSLSSFIERIAFATADASELVQIYLVWLFWLKLGEMNNKTHRNFSFGTRIICNQHQGADLNVCGGVTVLGNNNADGAGSGIACH